MLEKLSTLLQMMRSLAPDQEPTKGVMRNLKSLFKAAGREREIQVAGMLVGSMERPESPALLAYQASLLMREERFC